MKRRSFLTIVIGGLALIPARAVGAAKKPSPKPTQKAKVKSPSPTPKASPSTTPSNIKLEVPVTKDGQVIQITSLVAPTSTYASVTKFGREYPVLVARPTERAIRVFTARCPHQGNILNLASKGEFSCDLHGARFDDSTGKILGGPTISNLESYEVIERNGDLYIKF